jgi:hypothetical protein
MVVLDAQTTTAWRALMDEARARMLTSLNRPGGAVAQLGARLDGIEEVVGSNPIGSTKNMGVQPGDMGSSTQLRKPNALNHNP